MFEINGLLYFLFKFHIFFFEVFANVFCALGIFFSIAFIVTPYIGTLIAEKLGFNILWIGTGVLAAGIAIGFYFIIPWMLKDKNTVEEDAA